MMEHYNQDCHRCEHDFDKDCQEGCKMTFKLEGHDGLIRLVDALFGKEDEGK